MLCFRGEHKTQLFVGAAIVGLLLLISGCSVLQTKTKSPVNLEARSPSSSQNTQTINANPAITTPLADVVIENLAGDDGDYCQDDNGLPDAGEVTQPIDSNIPPPDPVIDPPISPPEPPAGKILFGIVSGLDALWSFGSGPLGPGEWSDHGGPGHGVWLGADAFDFGLPAGTMVYAAHDGLVTHLGYERYGVTIIEGEGFQTCYAHTEPVMFEGQNVYAGDLVGTVAYGHDGWFQQLHFELVDHGEAVPAGDYPAYF